MSRFLLLPTAFLLAPWLHAAAPEPGDTRKDAEAWLGAPVAVKTTAYGQVVAKYAGGTVTYYDNRVTKVALLTPEEMEKRKAEQKADELAAAARAKAAAEAKARRTAADNAARDAYLASDVYKQLSTAGRLAALTELAAKYPDAELAVLRTDLELMVAREDAARRDQGADAAARQQLDGKLAGLEERLNALTTQLGETTAANTRLLARLENAEIVNAALAQRVKSLEEAAAKPAPPPVVRPTVTPARR